MVPLVDDTDESNTSYIFKIKIVLCFIEINKNQYTYKFLIKY